METLSNKSKPSLSFRSEPEYYWKEKNGIKNNTVREITDEQKFNDLMCMFESQKYGNIKMYLLNNRKENFIRKIRDITIWKKLMVITWQE